MFAIGDKILYPMHGAGIVAEICKRDILGTVTEYYVLKLPLGEIEVMIPVDKCETIGVRPIISKDYVEKVFDVLKTESSPMPSNWNKRQRENTDKLKQGDILLVAEVVRNLIRVNRIKPLSAGEKKILSNARQILESELVLALDCDYEEAHLMVDEAV